MFIKKLITKAKTGDTVICIDGIEIPYTIRSVARSRSIRITVFPDGRVLVTKPMRVSAISVYEFVQTKADWILKNVTRKKQEYANRIPKNLGDYIKLRAQALSLATEKVTQWNQVYGFTYGKITIRNQSTRWGSCSSKGNLNFNYRMVHLTPELVDYLVIHELCHLREMNHGRKFWKLVSIGCPDYQISRKKLRLLGIGIG